MGKTDTCNSNPRQTATVAVLDSLASLSDQIQPRTTLYALEELGLHTGLVEGLTSYVMRLANEHSVSVGDIVGKVLARIPTSHGYFMSPSRRERDGDGYVFGAGSYSSNGVTDRSVAWVDALEATTGRKDLRLLTLLPLRSVIAEKLFFEKRRWCSLCLDQWRREAKPIYEPLIWAIRLASHCPIHCVQLSSTCHHCEHMQVPLAAFSTPGYCSLCGSWLGKSGIDIPESGGKDDLTSASKQIASIIEILPKIDPATVAMSLRRNINAYCEQVASGDFLTLARYMRCEHKTLRSWLEGSAVLRLGKLVQVAMSLDVPASSFLTATPPSSADVERARQAVALDRRPFISLPHQIIEIRQALLAAVDDEVAPALSEVARRLGFKGTYKLYYADRALCRQIVQRHLEVAPGRRKITVSPALIKETLTRALESSAPKALEQIARDLGYAGSGSLRSKFPDLCAAISKKVVDNTQLHYAKVSHALEDALKKNPAPTLAAVARSLGCASNTLQTHESELSSQLLALHRTQLEERKKALVKEAEAALTEVPPPSVRQLCIRLGVNAMTMLGYCPSAMKQLAEQHRLYIANETTRRQEALVSSVLGIATDLAGRNIYPSLPRIVERLPDGHVSDWRFTRRVVLETQRMLASSAGSFQSG